MHTEPFILPQAGKLASRARTLVVVIHTTGRGMTKVGEAVAPFGTELFDRTCAQRYVRAGLPYFGHRLIGSTGLALALARDDRRCAHAVALDPVYSRPNWKNYAIQESTVVPHNRNGEVVYDWWLERWAGVVNSPAEFIKAGNGRTINAYSVAIDVLPSPDLTYTDAQYVSVRETVQEFCTKYDIPFERRYVLGHADLDPLRRGTLQRASGTIVGVDWDPGRLFDWKRVVP